MSQPKDFSQDAAHAQFLDELKSSAHAPTGSSPAATAMNMAPALPAATPLSSQAQVPAKPRTFAVKQIGAGLQSCASDIWSSADVLRGAGIRGSDFPKMMMPFFALMLLESRLLRAREEMIGQFETGYGRAFDRDPQGADVQQDLIPAMQGTGTGFHEEIIETGLGLKHVSQVQGGNFLAKLNSWLDKWDPDTKRLLGFGYAEGQPKFLDIKGVASDLQAKSILWAFAQKWAAIDLTPYDNSEVTTIEEHIKRKWADISAETAGEQYTPSDLIALAVAIQIACHSRGLPADGIMRVYDPTCGGGNFVFAAEDGLREAFPTMSVVSRGQELNDQLYSLAAIEARFRPNSLFVHGNTLTSDGFAGEKFDAIVANPPYGVDWKTDDKTIKSDASGRFDARRMPPTSDGQLLFTQHIASHLSDHGVATVVHSGSTLFSGDAGGGESETRRWLLQDQDVVEAIIQLPKNMFFNTGISTYMWVLNANKPVERKNKVLVIDAQQCFAKLKKNLNQKNCEVDEANRSRIVDVFLSLQDSEIAKTLSVDDLLYNKVEIAITRKDAAGKGIEKPVSIDVKNCTLVLGTKSFSFGADGVCVAPPSTSFGGVVQQSSPKDLEAEIKAAAKEAGGDVHLVFQSAGEEWNQDPETMLITHKPGQDQEEARLGVGILAIKTKIAKTKVFEQLKLVASVEPLIEKDNETIPYSSDSATNDQIIQDFLTKWVKEPWKVTGAKVGCEINFNRLFPKKTAIRSSEEILKELAALDEEFKALEEKFAASLRGVKQ